MSLLRSPQTFTGKLLGGFCALAGTFILTLPIPIVVNSFANYYKNRLWRNEVAVKKDMRRKELKEQMRLEMEADRALEEAEKVESLLDMMEEENKLVVVEEMEDTDTTAPPSGVSLISRSSTFPV